jgi:hypothetical protein
MANDAYTKLLLTVIALCLIWLCAMTARPALAQHTLEATPQPVVIVGWGTFDAKGRTSVTMLQDRTGTRTSDPNIPVKLIEVPAGPIDVRLDYSDARPMPVAVTSIKRRGEWEPIRSAVEPEPVRSRPGRN